MAQTTPQELYEACPTLKEIAIRLADSVTETEQFNAANKGKTKKPKPGYSENPIPILSYKTKYPEHFRIVEFFKNGKWEKTTRVAKSGQSEFESALMEICASREPSGLKVEIYSGKRVTSHCEQFMCWIKDSATDPSITAEQEKTEKNTLNLGFSEGLSELRKELEVIKDGKTAGNALSLEIIERNFNDKLKQMEQEQKLQKLKDDHFKELEGRDNEIAELQDEIEELKAELAASDEELGNASELIQAKEKPKPFLDVLGDIAAKGLEKFARSNPELLEEFGISKERQLEIWRSQQQLLSNNNAGESNAASFSEAAPVVYENQTDPKHIAAAKAICTFVNQQEVEHFQYLFTIFQFLSDGAGGVDINHANKIIALIQETNQPA